MEKVGEAEVLAGPSWAPRVPARVLVLVRPHEPEAVPDSQAMPGGSFPEETKGSWVPRMAAWKH
ncbi:hypothetical protein BGE01nite_50380 [Brevifollis gellanilyticus]|uniref:Uncharacterized protein n=1 Tax=Brevifollis gellanilyticus TaxID=748831 RepID=A0A512MG82_9BACT|nr:hypothetical protein BGE01nite_50380 [Brevifollis gellanilyticus]